MNTQNKTKVKKFGKKTGKLGTGVGRPPIKAKNKKKKIEKDKLTLVVDKRESPVNQAIPDTNVLSTIAIVATMDPFARATWSCSFISRLAVLNTTMLDKIYYVYQAMDADFVATTQNETPVLFNRLAVVNTLFELITAKTINTPKLNVSYVFDGTTLSGAPSPTILIRGQNFFMYNPGADDGVSLSAMVVPPAVALPVAITNYNSALPKLVGNTPKKMLTQQKNEEGSKVFSKNASGYAQRAPYCNSYGSSEAGGYSSAELEVYSQGMSTLSTFVLLPSPVLRTALNLQFASLDTCATFGLPYLEGFKMLDYSTKLAPIVKYIDLTQLWTLYAEWLAETLRKAYTDVQNQTYVTAFVTTNSIPLTYAIIAFRQTVLRYFASSQAVTQFQGYSWVSGGEFEACRVGTNTVSRINVPLELPILLAENMRALAPHRYCTDGPKSERACRWYIPCIGLYNTTYWDNPTILLGDNNYSLFDPAVPSEAIGVNYVDGSSTATVCLDFNSQVINSAIFNINQVLGWADTYSGGVSFPQGSSPFNALAFTRYDEFSDVALNDEYFEKKPKWSKNPFLERLKVDYDSKKLSCDKQKTKSSKKFEYNLKNGIMNYFPRAYSSSMILTKEMMSVVQTLVIPSIVCYEEGVNLLVTQEGFQTAFSEGQSVAVNEPAGNNPDVLGTILAVLANTGKALAPGLAAKATPEVARIMEILQGTNGGSFLKAALSGVMAFASAL